MAFTTLDLLAAVVAAPFSANAGALYRLIGSLLLTGIEIEPSAGEDLLKQRS